VLITSLRDTKSSNPPKSFRKSDNAFLAIEDVAALQAAADRLSPQIIQKQLVPRSGWQ
jgi:hypothetical protein